MLITEYYIYMTYMTYIVLESTTYVDQSNQDCCIQYVQVSVLCTCISIVYYCRECAIVICFLGHKIFEYKLYHVLHAISHLKYLLYQYCFYMLIIAVRYSNNDQPFILAVTKNVVQIIYERYFSYIFPLHSTYVMNVNTKYYT